MNILWTISIIIIVIIVIGILIWYFTKKEQYKSSPSTTTSIDYSQWQTNFNALLSSLLTNFIDESQDLIQNQKISDYLPKSSDGNIYPIPENTNTYITGDSTLSNIKVGCNDLTNISSCFIGTKQSTSWEGLSVTAQFNLKSITGLGTLDPTTSSFEIQSFDKTKNLLTLIVKLNCKGDIRLNYHLYLTDVTTTDSAIVIPGNIIDVTVTIQVTVVPSVNTNTGLLSYEFINPKTIEANVGDTFQTDVTSLVEEELNSVYGTAYDLIKTYCCLKYSITCGFSCDWDCGHWSDCVNNLANPLQSSLDNASEGFAKLLSDLCIQLATGLSDDYLIPLIKDNPGPYPTTVDYLGVYASLPDPVTYNTTNATAFGSVVTNSITAIDLFINSNLEAINDIIKNKINFSIGLIDSTYIGISVPDLTITNFVVNPYDSYLWCKDKTGWDTDVILIPVMLNSTGTMTISQNYKDLYSDFNKSTNTAITLQIYLGIFCGVTLDSGKYCITYAKPQIINLNYMCKVGISPCPYTQTTYNYGLIGNYVSTDSLVSNMLNWGMINIITPWTNTQLYNTPLTNLSNLCITLPTGFDCSYIPTNEFYNTPLGIIIPFDKTTEPDGWKFCNGQALSIDDYNELFLLLGSKVSDGDNTTFNLPDIRDKFIFSASNDDKQSDLLNTGGNSKIKASHLPPHSHFLSGYENNKSKSSNNQNAINCTNNVVGKDYTGSFTGENIYDSDGNLANNLGNNSDYLPPYVRINYIICVNNPSDLFPNKSLIHWYGDRSKSPESSTFKYCDGTNSTPNLKEKFLLGVGDDSSFGDKGGNNTITIDQLPNHAHKFSIGACGHAGSDGYSGTDLGAGQSTLTDSAIYIAKDGDKDPNENYRTQITSQTSHVPPFVGTNLFVNTASCMKSYVGMIVVYPGNKYVIPYGWLLCDGSKIDNMYKDLLSLLSPSTTTPDLMTTISTLLCSDTASGGNPNIQPSDLPSHSHPINPINKIYGSTGSSNMQSNYTHSFFTAVDVYDANNKKVTQHTYYPPHIKLNYIICALPSNIDTNTCS